ncbi:hypothetical protein C8R45DRAFT_1052650 [Mycena sanguinolenta]|nr:hypothetical protein C8R45DRAFT_1052650 [Mycena sanguinolenta]
MAWQTFQWDSNNTADITLFWGQIEVLLSLEIDNTCSTCCLRFNITINRITTLEVLYEYPLDYVLEYPETSATGAIGHLFRMDPENWHDPTLNIAYSKGGHTGKSLSRTSVQCSVLVDALGNPIPCAERHTTYRDDRLQYVSPSRDIFLRTSAYLAAIQKLGCTRPLVEATNLSATEEEAKATRDLYLFQTQRGYQMKEGLCEGRIMGMMNFINGGSYHLEYIEAMISGDEQEAAVIEETVLGLGYGPLADCSTVANCSQQKAYCPTQVFEPKEDYRKDCPFLLIVSSGVHPHPVPLPTKPPPKIRTELMEILGSLAEDLPDIMPRRFICHPIVQSFLTSKYPLLVYPTLADWHVSLSNRSHIRAYIKQSIEEHCPFGTGWAGVVNLKAQQDLNLPPEQRYIRCIIAIPLKGLPCHDEDEQENDNKDSMVRIIICMSVEASRCLLSTGRYLQSDIAFQRIVCFLEFELACMDRDTNTNTGKSLKWRHLHATLVEGTECYTNYVLSWTADQHRGQAKGLGLHLQNMASKLPQKVDIHEPERNIQDLDPYEHLHRTFRVCIVHNFCNIKKCAVSDEVRWLMCSLVCIEHDDWEGTLLEICEKGRKAGNDWVNDKISSKFFFPGICWEQSFIPLEIWNAGDANSNLIESVHRDVNREGVHCTLLGGLKKGHLFDTLKMKTLSVANSQHRTLTDEDQKIEWHNEKLGKSLDGFVKAEKALRDKEQELSVESQPEKHRKLEDQLEKKQQAEERARKLFEKQRAESGSLKKGLGKVAALNGTE